MVVPSLVSETPPGVRSALSARPLVALGKISYGVYLFHWPVYVLIDRQAWELPAALDLVLKWAATVAVALVSYYAVEKPVRRNDWFVPSRTLVAALGLASMQVAGSKEAGFGTGSAARAICSARRRRTARSTNRCENPPTKIFESRLSRLTP